MLGYTVWVAGNHHSFTIIKIESILLCNLKSYFLSSYWKTGMRKCKESVLTHLHFLFLLANLEEHEKWRIRLGWVVCKERSNLTLSFNKKPPELCLESTDLFLSKDCSAQRLTWSALKCWNMELIYNNLFIV